METSDAADRRRAIEAILDRRPDVDVDSLAEVLRQLHFDVDEATLLADLDVLGFEVQDEPQVRSGPEPDRAAPDLATDPAPGAPSGGAMSEAWEPSMTPEAVRSSGRVPRSASVIGAVMVLVGALLLAAILAGGGSGGDDAEAGAPSERTAPVASGSPGDPAAPAPVEPSPLGPGEDPALVEGGDGASDFEGPDLPGLEGTAPGILTWEIVSGEWSVADGQARLAPVPEGEAALALIDPGLADYRVQVRLPELVDNVGLAFWADGTGDTWMLVAAPTYSSFNLVRVRDGEIEVIDNTGLTTTKDRAATIGLHVTGRRVEVLVDGAVLVDHDLDEDPSGTRFGLGGLPGAAAGSFDDLVYQADR